jgi:queuine tRNA-ribosyltransferase
MTNVRNSIIEGRFPDFVRGFVSDLHPTGDCPQWAQNAFESVGIKL